MKFSESNRLEKERKTFNQDDGAEQGTYSKEYLENALAELLALQKIIDRDIKKSLDIQLSYHTNMINIKKLDYVAFSVGRILLGIYFLLPGIGKIFDFSGTLSLMTLLVGNGSLARCSWTTICPALNVLILSTLAQIAVAINQ